MLADIKKTLRTNWPPGGPSLSLSLSLPALGLLAFVISAAMLGIALIFQYGFGYQPCVLCHYQRYVYLGIGGLGLAIAVFARLLPGLIAILLVAGFLGSAVLAGFHVGVENGYWKGTDACVGPNLNTLQSVEEMRKALLGTEVVRCDEVVWSLFGLSMADYNMLLSFAFAAVTFWLAWPVMRKHENDRKLFAQNTQQG